MKNIHLLPTDKPSRLYKVNSIGKLDWSEGYLKQVDGATNQNLYITSDEEIKEEDCVIALDTNIIFKVSSKDFPAIEMFKHIYKKIILTTDQDLINDGVQAIDDEFLEWFVKNPTCEWVELEKFEDGDCVIAGKEYINYSYEIIIPKEETKQETLEEHYLSIPKPLVDVSRMKLDNHPDKQETLEDFIKSIYPSPSGAKIRGIELGAKWQAERMYSEEEVYDIVEQAIKNYGKNQLGFFDGGVSNPIYTNLKKWFEQFKKK
jgi:hypothetical protein